MKKEFDFLDKEFKNEIKNFVQKMLGAPIVKIELDADQIDLCIDRTCDFMRSSKNVSQWEESFKILMAQDGALAHAKLMLGRVRAKFGITGDKGVNTKPSLLSANTIFPLDGENLLEEGERQYEKWKNKVFA